MKENKDRYTYLSTSIKGNKFVIHGCGKFQEESLSLAPLEALALQVKLNEYFQKLDKKENKSQPSCLGAVMCYFFGHKYRLKRHITPYLREVKCTRCKQEFGMNDQTQSVVPLDVELRELHRVL